MTPSGASNGQIVAHGLLVLTTRAHGHCSCGKHLITMADASSARRVRARTGPSITTILLDSDNIDEYPEYATDLGDKGEYEETHKIDVAIQVDSERVGLIKVYVPLCLCINACGGRACVRVMPGQCTHVPRAHNKPAYCSLWHATNRPGLLWHTTNLPAYQVVVSHANIGLHAARYDTISSSDHHWLSSAAKSGPVGCND